MHVFTQAQGLAYEGGILTICKRQSGRSQCQGINLDIGPPDDAGPTGRYSHGNHILVMTAERPFSIAQRFQSRNGPTVGIGYKLSTQATPWNIAAKTCNSYFCHNLFLKPTISVLVTAKN
jgi:hypothetical protein